MDDIEKIMDDLCTIRDQARQQSLSGYKEDLNIACLASIALVDYCSNIIRYVEFDTTLQISFIILVITGQSLLSPLISILMNMNTFHSDTDTDSFGEKKVESLRFLAKSFSSQSVTVDVMELIYFRVKTLASIKSSKYVC